MELRNCNFSHKITLKFCFKTPESSTMLGTYKITIYRVNVYPVTVYPVTGT